MLADLRPEAHLGDDLQAPARPLEVSPVQTVGIVEVEHRFYRFRRFLEVPLVADVEVGVGVLVDEVDAPVAKGPISAAE